MRNLEQLPAGLERSEVRRPVLELLLRAPSILARDVTHILKPVAIAERIFDEAPVIVKDGGFGLGWNERARNVAVLVGNVGILQAAGQPCLESCPQNKQ